MALAARAGAGGARAVGEKELEATVQAAMRRAADPEEECIAWSRACYKDRDHQGTVLVSNKRLLWVPLGGEKLQVNLALCSLRDFNHDHVEEGQAKLLVAVADQQLANGEGYLFIFDSVTEREGVRRLLEKVRTANDGLPQVAAKRKRGEGGEGQPKEKRARYGALVDKEDVMKSRQRAELMARDPSLRRLHNELVPLVLSEEEFWSSRRGELLLRQQSKDAQSTGMSSAMLNDVEPVSKANAFRPRYRITPQVIHQIFVEQPTVRAVYERNVPHKMTEKEFWTRYFKSRYFHRNKMRDKSDILSYGDDVLFRECRDVDDPQELTPNYAKLSTVNPLLNLTVEEEVPHGYGAPRVRDEISMKARPLIQRFNRHAELVLENPVATALDSSTPRKVLPGQETRRPSESATELEDLRKQEKPPVIPLNIPNQRVYFELAEHEEAGAEEHPATAHVSLLDWAPGCSLPQEPMDPLLATTVLSECTAEMRRWADAQTTVHGDAELLGPESTQLRLHNHLLKANELLRHFWRSYPITSAALLAKVQKLEKALLVMFDEVELLRADLLAQEAGGREGAAQLLNPLLRSLQQAIAVAKHTKPSVQSKRPRKRKR